MKGAFTGAVSDTLGFFRAANGGSIFLDEIGELSHELQAKLLRVLQESRVVPLGSTKGWPIDVRVICATNKDLRQLVLDGTFRKDLYFRLNVVQLELPPLRDRKDDILILAKYFLDKQAKLYREPPKDISAAAAKVLVEYDWPGNVRELANVVEHAYILSDSAEIKPSALPADVLTGALMTPEQQAFPTMEKVKEKLVLQALQATNGRKMAAAKLLNIDHRKLSRLIKKYNLQPTWK
jgi:transcriptional regulator with PAS, ATPase and Fis domain